MMEFEKNNNLVKSWDAFFNSVEEYNTNHSVGYQVSDMIMNGLKVYLNIPDSNYASLFIFDKENFDFEHRYTLPYHIAESAKASFNSLIDNYAISEAIQSRSPIFYPKEKDLDKEYFLVIPLISSSGVNGIIIISLDKLPEDIDRNHIRICFLHSSIISFNIENNRLVKDFKQMQSLLDQKVALKTMSLYQTKRELQTILDAVQIGIVAFETDNLKIINVNYIASLMLGFNPIELDGLESSIIFPDDQSNSISNTNDSVKISRIFESNIKAKSGKLIPVLRTATNVNFGDKKIRIDSFVDITDRKNFEHALQEANELLELKVMERTEDLQTVVNKLQSEISERIKAQNDLVAMFNKEKEIHDMKTKFLSMVSHEFRTPLTIIKTSSEILKNHIKKIDISEQFSYLSRIGQTVDKMTVLLDDVLQLGKYEETKQLNTIIMNLPELCYEIIHDLQKNIGQNRKINYHRNKENHFIYGDERLLRLIFNNLLSNAIKYSEEECDIDFELCCEKDFSSFIITDNGIGIPKKDQEKIFDSFHRGSNVSGISGTGLGLSIVLKSVKEHGGNIDIISNENQGTKVIIRIPFVTPK